MVVLVFGKILLEVKTQTTSPMSPKDLFNCSCFHLFQGYTEMTMFDLSGLHFIPICQRKTFLNLYDETIDCISQGGDTPASRFLVIGLRRNISQHRFCS